MQTLQDLANNMNIKHLHSLGTPARKAIEVADTTSFSKVTSLAHPAHRLYGRNFMLNRELHDAAFTEIRKRNGNADPCTTFSELREFTRGLEACRRGGE